MTARQSPGTLYWSHQELKAPNVKTRTRLKMCRMFCKKGREKGLISLMGNMKQKEQILSSIFLCYLESQDR